MPSMNDISKIMTSLTAYETTNREIKASLSAMQNSQLPAQAKEKALKAHATLRRNTAIGSVIIVLLLVVMVATGLGLLFGGQADALALTLLISCVPIGIMASLIGIILGRNSKSAQTWRHYARFVALGVDAYPLEELEKVQIDNESKAKIRTLRSRNLILGIILLIVMTITAIFLWQDHSGLFILLTVIYCVIYFAYDSIVRRQLLQIEQAGFIRSLKKQLENTQQTA